MDAVTIKFPVGYQSVNDPEDVRKIHDLLNRIPSAKGGAPVYFNPSYGYNANVTDVHILSFQNKWFPKKNCDAVVSPRGPTLRKMNELAKDEYDNRAFIAPNNVLAVMTKKTSGTVILKGFSRNTYYNEKTKRVEHYVGGRFEVPLYELKVGLGSVKDKTYTLAAEKTYMAVRFGVRLDEVAADKRRPAKEWYHIEAPPLGDFSLKRVAYSKGSWQLRGDFLIHVGPTVGGKDIFGSLGCIQPVNRGMTALDEQVREYSLGDIYREKFVDAAEADRRITQAGSFHCLVEPAPRPAIRLLDDFSHLGGPRPGFI